MALPRSSRLPGTAVASCVALSLLLAACGDDSNEPDGSTATDSTSSGASSGSLSVEVEPAQAAPGESIKAAVVNGTDEEFTYGAGYELERQVDGGLETVDLPERPVVQIGYVAPPGMTGPPVAVKLPPDLEPGIYRVVIQRDVPGVGDLSGQFEITGG